MSVGPLCKLFPRVYRVVSSKKSVVSDCYEVMVVLCGACLLEEVIVLLTGSSMGSRLFSNVFLCRNLKDFRFGSLP